MVRLMKVDEVLEFTGFGMSTLYRRMSDGDFPRPVQVGPRAVRWKDTDIEAWVEQLTTRDGVKTGT